MPPLWQLDQDLFRAINVGWRHPVLSPVMEVLSLSGLGYLQAVALVTPFVRASRGAVLALVVGVLVAIASLVAERDPLSLAATVLVVGLAWTIKPKVALGMAASVVVSGIVRLGYVAAVPRDRPSNLAFALPLEHVYGSTSFPSGHTTTSWALVTVFCLLSGRERPVLAVVLSCWAALVAVSRVYVGVHYPLDTVAGALIGCGMGAIVAWWLKGRIQETTSPIERNLS